MIKAEKDVFEDKGLNSEVIQDLKRRAERTVRERQRRSQSREPERPKEERQATPILPPVPEGLGAMVQLMGAKGTQDEVVRLVQEAKARFFKFFQFAVDGLLYK